MACTSVSMDFKARTGPRATLCSAVPQKPRYRRSTTSKAPRKRSFVANMTKYSEEQLRAASMVAGVAKEAPLSHTCLSFDNGDNNNNNGANNNGNGNGRKSGGNGGNGDAFRGDGALPMPALVIAAGFAVAAAFVMAPPTMAAIPLNAVSTRRAALGATTVRPARGPVVSAAEPAVIPYGRVFLNNDEQKMLAERQYRVRETMRVYY